jgi:hypothetical protein
VLCWVNYQSKFFMLVFSSATGNWRIAACHSWSSFGTVAETSEIMLCFSCVRGRLYWTAPCWNKLLVLDTCTMEFSAVDILTSYHMQLINLREQRIWSSSFVLATEGALEMFTLIRDCSLNDLYYIYHSTQRNDDHSSSACELKIFIVLPRPYWHYLTTGGAMYATARP